MARTYGKAQDLIDFTRASSATYLDSDGLLKTASNNIPRIEYDANGNLLGLLVEESRGNLVANSEDIGGLNQATASDDVAIAPDGTQTADKLIESSANSVHWTYNSITASDNQDYTFSVFAKKSERTRLTIYPNDKSNVGFNAVYDLDAGTVVSTPPQMTTSIHDVGNGWYRCIGTFNAGTGAALVYVRTGLVSSGTTISYQGDGSSGLFIWGQQLEAGSFPTSYIPTSGSTATRSADVASLSTSAFGYNGNEGTFFVEYDRQYTEPSGGTYPKIIQVTDGTGNNRFHAQGAPSSANMNIATYNSGSSTSLTPASVFASSHKIAISIDSESSFKFVIDGTISGSIATNIVDLSLLTDVEIGLNLLGPSQQLNGHIKSLKYIPRELIDSQLEALTA